MNIQEAGSLLIEELRVPYGLPHKWGRLFVAYPHETRPATITDAEWAVSIVRAASALTSKHLPGGSMADICLMTPFSLWGESGSRRHERTRLLEQGGLDNNSVIHLMDAPGDRLDFPAQSLLGTVTAIVEALSSGTEIVILSSNSRPSGFVPALLTLWLEPEVVLPKVLYPILDGSGYELTAFQLGCIYAWNGMGKRLKARWV